MLFIRQQSNPASSQRNCAWPATGEGGCVARHPASGAHWRLLNGGVLPAFNLVRFDLHSPLHMGLGAGRGPKFRVKSFISRDRKNRMVLYGPARDRGSWAVITQIFSCRGMVDALKPAKRFLKWPDCMDPHPAISRAAGPSGSRPRGDTRYIKIFARKIFERILHLKKFHTDIIFAAGKIFKKIFKSKKFHSRNKIRKFNEINSLRARLLIIRIM